MHARWPDLVHSTFPATGEIPAGNRRGRRSAWVILRCTVRWRRGRCDKARAARYEGYRPHARQCARSRAQNTPRGWQIPLKRGSLKALARLFHDCVSLAPWDRGSMALFSLLLAALLTGIILFAASILSALLLLARRTRNGALRMEVEDRKR